MSSIRLENLKHSYLKKPKSNSDWALKEINLHWDNGGAYALLGPSGCGKTTMLNIISGLLTPKEGKIWFDSEDFTTVTTEQRNIAQVFQFPVVYDTMTVYDNLAFPLRNRKMKEEMVDQRVQEVAEMLDLSSMLKKKAAGLTADSKQKISLGRGLVRPDVNAILFDEPLTVIDPHLKWTLRSKLKDLHQRLKLTMIYVTHDQTEALTFADQVVVMHEGLVVQIGTPDELFEQPKHQFVGYFIGSPGMNFLPAKCRNQQAFFADQLVTTQNVVKLDDGQDLNIGVRPEFIHFATEGLATEITKVDDVGHHLVVSVLCNQTPMKIIVPEGQGLPSKNPRLQFNPNHTFAYKDNWLIK